MRSQVNVILSGPIVVRSTLSFGDSHKLEDEPV